MGKLEGVVKVEASLEKKSAAVTYVPAKVTIEQIKNAIEGLGFGCELLESDSSGSDSSSSLS